MYVWKDKEGKKLTGKEFLSRWKEGINSVTPLQRTRSELVFTYIIMIGLIGGIITSIIAIKTLWWLIVVLSGAFGLQCLSLIAILQKYNALKKFEEQLKGGINQIDEQKSTA